MSNLTYTANLKEKVALGLVEGWTGFRKFGMNDAVASGTPEEMWPIGTPRVLQTSAFVASAVSDDAADATGGTGLLTLTIEGLDSNYLEVSETVAMNGITPVTTTQTFLRINRVYGATGGTAESNVGAITISLNGEAQAFLEPGEGQTHQTQYTVPAGKTIMVTSFIIGVGRMSGSSDCQIASYIKLQGTGMWRAISDVYLFNGQIHTNENSATVIPQKTDIKQVITSTSATQAYSTWSGYLIDNKQFNA